MLGDRVDSMTDEQIDFEHAEQDAAKEMVRRDNSDLLRQFGLDDHLQKQIVRKSHFSLAVVLRAFKSDFLALPPEKQEKFRQAVVAGVKAGLHKAQPEERNRLRGDYRLLAAITRDDLDPARIEKVAYDIVNGQNDPN